MGNSISVTIVTVLIIAIIRTVYSEGINMTDMKLKNGIIDVNNISDGLKNYVQNQLNNASNCNVKKIVDIFSKNIYETCNDGIKRCQVTYEYCDETLGHCASCEDLCKTSRKDGFNNGKDLVFKSCQKNCGVYLLKESLEEEAQMITAKPVPKVHIADTLPQVETPSVESKGLAVTLLFISGFLVIFFLLLIVFRTYNKFHINSFGKWMRFLFYSKRNEHEDDEEEMANLTNDNTPVPQHADADSLDEVKVSQGTNTSNHDLTEAVVDEETSSWTPLKENEHLVRNCPNLDESSNGEVTWKRQTKEGKAVAKRPTVKRNRQEKDVDGPKRGTAIHEQSKKVPQKPRTMKKEENSVTRHEETRKEDNVEGAIGGESFPYTQLMVATIDNGASHNQRDKASHSDEFEHGYDSE